MSEVVQYPSTTTIVTDTINAGNVAVNNDLLDQWAYLKPSPQNSSTIIAGLTRLANTYINNQAGAFWSNNALTYTFLNFSLTAATDKFVGGCQLADGRVVFAPWNVAYIGIFNPATNTWATLATSGTGNTIDQYQGCVLAPDGRAIFVPWTATAIGIYNPVTNTWSTVGGLPSGGKFCGGTVIPDGRILFIASGNVQYFGIFDPLTNTYSSITPTGSAMPTGSGHIGGCLYTDGRIIMPPSYNNANIGIYDPVTNVFTTVPGVRPTNANGEYDQAFVIPDGRVAFIPRGANPANLGLFDPRTNNFTTITGPTAGTQWFISGCVLPDGRVFCAPAWSTYGLVFNTVNNTYTTIPGLPGNNAYNGAMMLKDGRVIGMPGQGTGIGIFSGFNQGIPAEYVMHPFFNQNC
jgi:hypothetical protein